MNFVAGVLIMFIIFMPIKEIVVPVIDSFESYSTVDGENGLHIGDEIVEIDGENIYMQSDISMILSLNPGDVHDLVVIRDGKKIALDDMVLQTHEVTDENGNSVLRYGMNFTIAELSFWERVEYSWNQCINTVRNVRMSLQMLLTGRASLNDMSGPVGIVHIMSDTANASETVSDAIINMIYFGGFLAINLAVMNLLPIPALDGGRVVCLLLTLAYEKITRKKIDPKYEGYLHGVGMVLLLGLMAVIMFKDIFVIFKG
jgi:regulator of sigma E protease